MTDPRIERIAARQHAQTVAARMTVTPLLDAETTTDDEVAQIVDLFRGGRFYGTEFGGGGGSSWMDTAVCSDLTFGTDPFVVQGFVLFEWEHADPPVHASRQLGLGRGTRGLS